MKNGPGYLDVAVCSHMDMLKVGCACGSYSLACHWPRRCTGSQQPALQSACCQARHLHAARPALLMCSHYCGILGTNTRIGGLDRVQAQGSCPKNITLEEYARQVRHAVVATDTLGALWQQTHCGAPVANKGSCRRSWVPAAQAHVPLRASPTVLTGACVWCAWRAGAATARVQRAEGGRGLQPVVSARCCGAHPAASWPVVVYSAPSVPVHWCTVHWCPHLRGWRCIGVPARPLRVLTCASPLPVRRAG